MYMGEHSIQVKQIEIDKIKIIQYKWEIMNFLFNSWLPKLLSSIW